MDKLIYSKIYVRFGVCPCVDVTKLYSDGSKAVVGYLLKEVDECWKASQTLEKNINTPQRFDFGFTNLVDLKNALNDYMRNPETFWDTELKRKL